MRTFYSSGANCTVSAYEDVTVPAGTFQAYRIDWTGKTPDVVSGTFWYAPSVKTTVRANLERTTRHYLGPAKTTYELLTVPK